MELTELQEIINRHGKNLKQEIGLALSEQESKDIIKYAVSEVFSLHVVSGSADADYWSERCKHAENIWKKSPCDPDITDEQIEAHNRYHNFIKENGSKHYL